MPVDYKELRLGNYVYSVYKPYGHEQGRLYKKVGLREFNIATGEVKGSFYLEAIPITEELLLRIGFKEDVPKEVGDVYCKNYYNQNNLYISQWIHDEPLAGFEKKGTWYVGDYIEIPSLHWLQNWYYFNSGGKEMEINI